MFDLKKIDKNWTLFLDRDGVINHDKPNDYVNSPCEFRFYEDVLKALAYFNKRFGRIIVVTNQRGVGRGLMTEEDLLLIHEKMLLDIDETGGRIDKIYYCTSMDNEHPNRKPNPGMAIDARKDFPDIDFSRAVIVGNNLSDMGFGRNAGIHTVFVRTTNPEVSLPHPLIDMAFDTLPDFAKALQSE